MYNQDTYLVWKASKSVWMCKGPEEMEQYGARLSESESDDDQDEMNYTTMLVS